MIRRPGDVSISIVEYRLDMEAGHLAPGVIVAHDSLPEPVEVFSVSRSGSGISMAGLGTETGSVHRRQWALPDISGLRRCDPSTLPELTPLQLTRVSLAIPPDRDNNFWYVHNSSDTVVVFVHGIFSNSRTCWLYKGQRRSIFWPDLLRVDARFDEPSIYLAGYFTAFDAGDFPLDQCARQVLEAIERPDLAGGFRVLDQPNLIFVCHSTGGIVVRYLLSRYLESFRAKRVGLALIASPSRGSVWANVAGAASRYYNQRLGSQLRWRGEAIDDIHTRFQDLVNTRGTLIPGLFGMEACETRMVFRKHLPKIVRWFVPNRFKVVSTESAGQYFGQVKYLPDTDHFSSVKPDSIAHPSHEFLETFVRRFREFNAGTSPSQRVPSLPERAERTPGTVSPTPGGDRRSSWNDFLDAQRQLVDESVRNFVGRSQSKDALAQFVKSSSRGYFIVTGGPGLGKTALSCQVIQEWRAIYHLARRDGERGDVRSILSSYIHQIATRLATAVELDRDLQTLTKTFDMLLRQMAKVTPGQLLVLDALDELDDGVGDDLPFIPADALPHGLFMLITCRPGSRLDRLREQISEVPSRLWTLNPMGSDEVRQLLQRRNRDLSEQELAWIEDVSQGSPLYLQALAEELETNPRFDLNELPPRLDDYYHRAVRRLPNRAVLLKLVAVLTAAEAPIPASEVADIAALPLKEVDEAVQAIRPFLLQSSAGLSFYHQSFNDFVRTELLDLPRLQAGHLAIARWLLDPSRRNSDRAWRSLSFHLYHAGDAAEFYRVIDDAFLGEKVRRFGFAVLDDVEFLTKSMLDTGEPSSVERSVAIVESLRKVAGGDLMHAAEHAVHLAQVVPRAGKAAVMRVSTPTMDVYAGMIPKIGVSADFVEIVPADRKLFILVGDMPGAGLKSAFVARFLANLFKRLVRLAPSASVTELMSMIAHTVLPVEYFDRVSMQCIEIDEEHERLHIANAGHPYPVLYSGRRKKSDRLAVRGSLFERDAEGFGSYAQRSAEIYPGDVLVLISDGLTEASRADNPYGYRFCQLLEDLAGQSARTVGEAILTSWRTHPRPLDWVDDTTVVVVVIRPPT